MSIYDLPFIIALCSLTVQDLKQCLIDSRLLAPAFLLGVTHHDSHPVTAFIIYVCALIINHHYREKFLGNGDLDVILLVLFIYHQINYLYGSQSAVAFIYPLVCGSQLSHYPSYQP